MNFNNILNNINLFFIFLSELIAAKGVFSYSKYLKFSDNSLLNIYDSIYFLFFFSSSYSFFFDIDLYFLFNCLNTLLLIVPLLLAVAFFTLVERKIMASLQRRKGPNFVGFFGLLQPFADAVKLVIKETVIPSSANFVIFVFAPILCLFLSIMGWAVIPLGNSLVFLDVNLGVLYIFGVSSLSVYSIILSGWSSNSKYAFLGCLRSSAQMISYEVSIGLIIICVLLCSGSLNFSNIVNSQQFIWYIVPLFPLALMFFISALAETNRPPFDLPEAEAELVAGYNVEYSAAGFALFFIGEYSNILLMSSLFVIFFLGGWLPPMFILTFLSYFNILNYFSDLFWFILKLIFVIFSFVWVRASLPRYRYDQLMTLGWKVFLPLSISFVIFISGFLISFDFLY